MQSNNVRFKLVSTLGTDCVLLWQVACEYINASRKMQAYGLDYAAAIQNIRDLQLSWRFILPTVNVLERAVLNTITTFEILLRSQNPR